MTQNKQTTISWQAPEYKHYEKNIGWYVTLVSVIVLISAFFIFVENDYFAAVTIALLGGLVIFFATQKPNDIEIELNHKSVRFGNLHFPYKQIKHFWVVHNQRHQAVNLVTTTYINNVIVLELVDQDPDEIREFLLQYLPEHETSVETFSQKIMHWFKF
jgi:hypothetical protein